ncbi:uncharacterized protein LOC131609899 isoform X2 [Vicia villosa]|uniref:uncharacterized protein LOC131609899 isoform X2 n=1 Tax=Vicia villosa TaxID=3911 RepID=UPI00273BEC5B|nr:uncharacterized protein LOC131609899 isoform X2 [Vicia villosa]
MKKQHKVVFSTFLFIIVKSLVSLTKHTLYFSVLFRKRHKQIWKREYSFNRSMQTASSGGNLVPLNEIQLEEFHRRQSISAGNERLMRPDQVSELEHVFKLFDKDDDGKVLPAELQQCMEALGEMFSPQDAAVAVAFLDKEGDGLLDFDDFVWLVEAGRNEEDNPSTNLPLHRPWISLIINKPKRFGNNPKISPRTNVLLPLSSNDLVNTTLQQNDFTWKAFMGFLRGSVRNLSPKQHGFLLLLFGGILSYLTRNSTNPFESFQFGKTTNTPESLLSLEEAFYAFPLELAHISGFMISYIMMWLLVLPLHPGIQIFLGLLLIFSPIFYFGQLVRMASISGVHVDCGGVFKLPLIWFATLGAVGLSLAIGLVLLLVVYLSWRFIHKGKPKVIEVRSDDLSPLILDE